MRKFLRLFRPASASGEIDNVYSSGNSAVESILPTNEAQFCHLVAGVLDYAIFLLDADGHVMTWNAGAERIKGFRADDIIGEHFSRFYTSEAVSAKWPEHELEVASQTGRFEDEGWRVRQDGSQFWANVTITALRDENGGVRGFLKITRDLTDRRQAEEKLRISEERSRLLIEGVRDYAIFMIDPRGYVTTWNTGAERLKGYTASEIVGEHFSKFYPPDLVQAKWPEHELQQAAEHGRFEDEGWRVRKDGTRFWANAVITALKDDQGVVRGFAKVTRDLSERRLAEENARKLLQEEASRKAAEAAAREIEQQKEQLRVTLTSIGDAVIVTDIDGRVTFLNPVASRLTGWNAEEAVGQPLERVFHIINEKSRKTVENPVERVFRENIVVGLANHTALISKDGKEVPIEDTAAPIRDEQGRTGGAVLVFRDVTEARHALEARLRLAAIVESSDDAILSKNLDGIITSWNRGAERLYGYLHEEIIGKPLYLLVPPEHQQEIPAIIQRIRQGEKIEHFETQRIRKDGRRVDVSLTISPIKDAEGRIIGASKIARDITERKRVEQSLRVHNERLRLLWQAAVVLLDANNPDAMLQRVFHTVADHLGLDCFLNHQVNESGDGLRLASYFGITAEQARQMDRLKYGEGICGSVALTQEPIVATDIQDSTDPHFQFMKSLGFSSYVCNPLTTGGKVIGTLSFGSRRNRCFTHDELEFVQTLTRYVNVAYERLQVILQLQHSDRRKDEFLATLAHELRNPLAPIRTGLEIMKMADNDPETVQEIRDTMERQTEQLIALVNDLLDVSRITMGKLELRRCRVELADVFESAVEASTPFINEAGHELTVSVPQEPVFIDADPHRLAQVISNLLNNAAKYTPESGKIQLSATRENGQVLISVKDNGIGIPSEMAGRIFEMFAQIERPLEKTYTGLGIGLTLVKSLVEMHGGKIEVHSEGENRGSEFIIRLPVLVDQAPQTNVVPLTPDSANRARKRILVVDDNRAAAEMLSKVVKMLGNDVMTAGDGQQAIELAADFHPDVILMDLGMPKMNGYDAARHIREQPWGDKIVLVALTGWGQEEDKQRTRQAGFDHHLVKPAEPTALQEILSAKRNNKG